MADLVVVPASVVTVDENPNLRTGEAGESIAQGDGIYLDATDNNRVKKAQADSQEKAASDGVAVNAAESGQPVQYLASGKIKLGVTLVVGETYVVSNTAGGGKIAPIGDVAAGWFVTHFGVATSTTDLDLRINRSGVARA